MEIKQNRVVGCQWNSVVKAEIVECRELPTIFAKRCNRYFCAFHYAIGKDFPPYENEKASELLSDAQTLQTNQTTTE